MRAIFSRVRHPSHPGRGHGSLTCHMTQFERSDWLRSENFTNTMMEYWTHPTHHPPTTTTTIFLKPHGPKIRFEKFWTFWNTFPRDIFNMTATKKHAKMSKIGIPLFQFLVNIGKPIHLKVCVSEVENAIWLAKKYLSIIKIQNGKIGPKHPSNMLQLICHHCYKLGCCQWT